MIREGTLCSLPGYNFAKVVVHFIRYSLSFSNTCKIAFTVSSDIVPKLTLVYDNNIDLRVLSLLLQ